MRKKWKYMFKNCQGSRPLTKVKLRTLIALNCRYIEYGLKRCCKAYIHCNTNLGVCNTML